MMEHVNETEWNAYLAGTCKPDRLVWIDEHVKICPQCRESRQNIEAMADMLKTWQVDSTGHDIAAKVTETVRRQSLQLNDTVRLQFRRRLVSYAVRIAATLAIGISLGHWAGQSSAKQHIAKQQGTLTETTPSYLAALDLHFASDLTWSVLEEDPSDMEVQE